MVRVLYLLNILATFTLGVMAFYLLITDGQWAGLILFAALLVVGPVEDLLVHRLVHAPPVANRTHQIIDRSTSLVLILGMIAATLLQ